MHVQYVGTSTLSTLCFACNYDFLLEDSKTWSHSCEKKDVMQGG